MVDSCVRACGIFIEVQWNVSLTKCQGTGETGSLYRGFVISRFFSIHYTITGLKISFVIPRTSLHRGSLNRSSTVRSRDNDSNF